MKLVTVEEYKIYLGELEFVNVRLVKEQSMMIALQFVIGVRLKK